MRLVSKVEIAVAQIPPQSASLFLPSATFQPSVSYLVKRARGGEGLGLKAQADFAV